MKSILFLIKVENEKKIGLRENWELFYEICDGKWFAAKTKIVLLLNHTDVFKEHLKITPLTFCFGDEYKGRNYNDNAFGKDDMEFAMRFMTGVLRFLLENDQCVIPLDVIGIVMEYFALNDWWLELCYRDGIEFIKKKYLSLIDGTRCKDRIVPVYEVCAVNPDEMEPIMCDVRNMLSLQTIAPLCT